MVKMMVVFIMVIVLRFLSNGFYDNSFGFNGLGRVTIFMGIVLVESSYGYNDSYNNGSGVLQPL